MNSWESTPRLTGIPGPRSGGAILLPERRQGAASDKGIDMQEMPGRYQPIIRRGGILETQTFKEKLRRFPKLEKRDRCAGDARSISAND